MTLLSTPTTLAGGPRQTLGKLTKPLPLGWLLERSNHRRRHAPRSRGCITLQGVRSPLRSPWYPVSASPVSFGLHLLHRCNTRSEWLVRPSSAGTYTLQEAPRCAWRTNAGAHLLPEAGLGRRKARCIAVRFLPPPVEPRACDLHRTRRNPCGPSPWRTRKRLFPLRRHPQERARVFAPIAPACTRTWRVHSWRVRWGLCASLPFVLRTATGAGPSPWGGSPGGRLSRPPPPLPQPTLRAGFGVA